jgi:hypothetical protein
MMPAKKIAQGIMQDASRANTAPGQSGAASLKDKAVAIGLGALVIGGGFLVARKMVKNARKNRKQKLFTEEGQQALLIHSALNPSGMSWLKWMDGTKEEAIFEVARQIKKFKKVAQEYKILYNKALVSDLEKELSTEDYNKFMDIVNSGGDVSETGPGTPSATTTGTNNPGGNSSGKVILIENKTKLYKSLAWYPLAGGIKTVEKGSYVPFLTDGKAKLKTIAPGIVLYFVGAQVMTRQGGTKTIYAPANDIKLVSPADFQNNYKSYKKITFSDAEF